jgi:hypothetical protein
MIYTDSTSPQAREELHMDRESKEAGEDAVLQCLNVETFCFRGFRLEDKPSYFGFNSE